MARDSWALLLPLPSLPPPLASHPSSSLLSPFFRCRRERGRGVPRRFFPHSHPPYSRRSFSSLSLLRCLGGRGKYPVTSPRASPYPLPLYSLSNEASESVAIRWSITPMPESLSFFVCLFFFLLCLTSGNVSLIWVSLNNSSVPKDSWVWVGPRSLLY